jgi:hypothetical protein
MQNKPGPEKPAKTKPASTNLREERLKVALKANMARRKAQVKARANDNENEGA